MPLINCEIEPDFSWPKECIISANPLNPLIQATSTSDVTFQINNVKLYVPVVTLSISDNIKFLENIKQGIKKITSWNKQI